MIYLLLLLGYLLSGLGYLLYQLWIRQHIAPKQRKVYIYTMIGLSFLLPLLFLHQDSALPSALQRSQIVAVDDFVNDPVLDEALIACYDKVNSQEGLCHCEQLQQSNLLYYQSNPFYNFLIQHRTTIGILAGLVAILVLLGLLAKVIYLIHLIYDKNTVRKTIINDGKKYILLKRIGDVLAASFRLWDRYILWHPQLDALPADEQQAILMHEIAHLDNGDTFEQIGLSVLQAFWIANPIYYYIKKELDLINEFIADQFALKNIPNALSYAKLLVKLKEQQQLGLSNHLSNSSLKTRLLAILHPQQFIGLRYMPAIITAVAAAMLAFSASTAPVIHEQYSLYEEYCYMHNEHGRTGRKVFCRACLYEDLQKERQQSRTWTRKINIEEYHEHEH